MEGEPTLQEFAAMPEEEQEALFCENWEDEEHRCANIFCPGCE